MTCAKPLSIPVLLATLCSGAQAQDFVRAPAEADEAFATRVLHLSGDADPHVTSATWNGAPTLFVDYRTTAEYPERPLVALQPQASHAYRAIQVTVGEQEGGTPGIIAIGLADARHHPAETLIVILAWPQEHLDVNGTLYEVRIFDPPKPGQTDLAPSKISQHFGAGCECSRSDGTNSRYRYTTIAAVQAELKRLGYAP
ncbi:MAG TPA: hypothetical protein VJY39_10160 [Acidisphaera sp.]|nr:hypothetical protein [Acidisphaera sp.]